MSLARHIFVVILVPYCHVGTSFRLVAYWTCPISIESIAIPLRLSDDGSFGTVR
jgi:hypothetical protein